MIDREKVIKGVESCIKMGRLDVENCRELNCPYFENGLRLSCWIDVLADVLVLLKDQEAVVHPEPSCEMTYITDCCCDLCGVQLIREDNFCRCCGKPIVWEGW